MNIKYSLLFFIFIIILLFSVNNVHACSLIQPSTFIKCEIEASILHDEITCLNEDCSANVTKNSYGRMELSINNLGDRFYIDQQQRIHLPRYYPDNTLLISYINSICVEDVNSITSLLSNKKQYYGNLFFEPYTLDAVERLDRDGKNYLKCQYQSYKKEGDWLVIYYEQREYCYQYATRGGMCPYPVISNTQFIGFILSNPNVNTLPYVVIYIIPIFSLIGFMAYLVRRKELRIFFKRSLLFIILAIIILAISIGIITFLFFHVSIDTIILIFGYIFLVISLKYLYDKKRKKKLI